ncbi:MAG: Rpn family recombination-promoting nuclease/putative transposase [Treponema sp.]|nr:Rpn family recombination-promoting nuclease/putative transposase [Treponema sp.]
MNKELLSPIFDFVFKYIWGDQRNSELTAALVRAILRVPESEIDQLTITDPFLKRFWRKDKQGIVDVKMTDKTGRIINIEIQARRDKHMRNRIVYYLAKMLWEQLKRGGNYGQLNRVISIVICDHTMVNDEPHYQHAYSLENEKTGDRFTDLVQIIIIELPKLPKEADGTEEWPWLQFFKCKTLEEFNMLAAKFPQIRRAVDALKEISMSDHARALADARQKAEWAQWAREEDRFAEGKEQGKEQEKMEIIKKALEKGLAIGDIADLTGYDAAAIEGFRKTWGVGG